MDALSRIKILIQAVFLCAVSLVDGTNAQGYEPGKSFRDCPECPEMVVIPSGSFMMGSSDEDTQRDLAAVPPPSPSITIGKLLGFTDQAQARKFMAREHPQHPVTITRNFAMGKYLVTTAEYAAFVQETRHSTATCYLSGHSRAPDSSGEGWRHPGFLPTPRDPVVCVSWSDAQPYIDWLNKKISGSNLKDEAGPYRLPSEAEWEYAARAGTKTSRWWGDDIGFGHAKCDGCEDLTEKRQPEIVGGHVIYPPCCGPQYERRTAPVGSFPANGFGLYDMLGNAWEITDDCWHDDYKGAPSDGRPWIGANCNRDVRRGGGWTNSPWSLRSATRTGGLEGSTSNSTGFRVAKTIP